MAKPHKLLIIDDNEDILTALHDFFSKKNYDVVSASDGFDGLKLLETDKQGVDLVITDLVMPSISGVGVISIIRNKFPDLPVIAITGYGEHPGALATEAQADHVLEKPFELDKLDGLIRDLLTPKKD
jgi:DNA-binding NtrC family response regulator